MKSYGQKVGVGGAGEWQKYICIFKQQTRRRMGQICPVVCVLLGGMEGGSSRLTKLGLILQGPRSIPFMSCRASLACHDISAGQEIPIGPGPPFLR